MMMMGILVERWVKVWLDSRESEGTGGHEMETVGLDHPYEDFALKGIRDMCGWRVNGECCEKWDRLQKVCMPRRML